MKKHRILSGLLAFVLVLSLLPTAAFAAGATSGECGEYAIWTFDQAAGTLTISGTGEMDPALWTAPWDEFGSSIKRVEIKEGIVSISECAFDACPNLAEVSIPKSVTAIGPDAFAGTLWLKSLGEFAIANGILLKYQGSEEHVVIPSGVTSIASGAFSENTDIVSVTIPEGVVSMGMGAMFGYVFWGCTNLESITFPGTLEAVGRFCFTDTKWLANQGDFAMAGSVLVRYQGKNADVVIPDGVTALADGSFQFLDEEGEVIPASLTVPVSMKNLNFDMAFFMALPGYLPGTIIYKGTQAQWDMIEGVKDSYYLEEELGIDVKCTGSASAPAAGAGTGSFQKVNTYAPGTFTDVPASAWYAGNVQAAYELGLVMGSSGTTFSPTDNITLAASLALACRLHSIYYNGSADFVQGSVWYQVYVDYAIANGIISAGQFSDYNATATRRQFAAIMANALPASALGAINTVADGAIPDVPTGAANYDAIYRLYRAGILTGNDAQGTFAPETYINRAAVAALVTRMADPSLRQSVTLQAAQPTPAPTRKQTPTHTPEPTPAPAPRPAAPSYNDLVDCYNKTVEPWNAVMVIGPKALLADMARVAIELQNMLSRPDYSAISTQERKRTDALRETREAIDGLLPCAQIILDACSEYPDIFAEAKATTERVISDAKTLRTLNFTQEGDYDVAKEIMDLWLELSKDLDIAQERIKGYK